MSENMSIEEILAACRAADGEGGGQAPESATDAAPEPADAPAAAREESPPAGKPKAKAPGEMCVADMLAAARSEKGRSEKGAGGQPQEVAPAAAQAKPAAGKKPGAMSVEEMLAAARAEKSGGKAGSPKPAAKKPAAAGKKSDTGAGTSKAAPAANKPAGPKDTASILAAARGAKPGPITKAEAARRSAPETATGKATGKAKLEVPPMPTKPAYALPQTAPAAAGDRRGFFAVLTGVFVGSSVAVGFSSLVATNLLWALGLARFMFPNILTEPPTQFKVGFPDELAPGQVETKYKAQFGVWIVKDQYDGIPQVFALQSVCTHLGCTPNWLEGEQKFKCPCHGSGFYKDGVNFEGPAPRPLERFAIRLADDGQLEVDKSRKFKEEVGQWKDTSSFVPV